MAGVSMVRQQSRLKATRRLTEQVSAKIESFLKRPKSQFGGDLYKTHLSVYKRAAW